ncbi:MAG: prephenate dehydrogenase/arogenate dehydrogenase family protein [Heliobacteriaceae bacterium]|nr:prephenate dehydrogenase/arogenate dehydrogenase family protein [Heliobacteriaceae bacterium]
MQGLVGQVTIIGLGVIGGSLGLALSRSGLVGEVVGYDQDAETLGLALATKTVHRVEPDLRRAVTGAAVVVLATPVGTYPAIIRVIRDALAPGTILTDVGSTKQWVLAQMDRLLPPGVHFVGGHPMAGSEKTGLEGADRYLLQDAVYVLTPTAETDEEAMAVVARLVTAVGARVVKLPAPEHDHVAATVSHLPHMVAVALVDTFGQVAAGHPAAGLLAAGGFRDMTRIAAGDPQLWRDVVLTNRGPLLAMLRLFGQNLAQLVQDIEGCGDVAGEAALLKGRLERVRQTRLALPEQG